MNRPDVTALARQLARQQAVIAERDAEIAELKQMVDALGETIDTLLDDSDKLKAGRDDLPFQYALVSPLNVSTVDLSGVNVLTWGNDDHATE
jgi:uncharacterized coiled-coil protein SlyX